MCLSVISVYQRLKYKSLLKECEWMCHLFPKRIWAGVVSFHYLSEGVSVGATSMYESCHLRKLKSDENHLACEPFIEHKIQFDT